MKKKLADSLRHMQANPTTGTPHNQQVISTQVETIFAVDELKKEITKLSNIIEKANRQSEKLEQSNYTLQVVMLILTAIATAVAVSPMISSITKYLISLISTTSPAVLSTIITSLVSGVAGFATYSAFEEYLRNLSMHNKILKQNISAIEKLKVQLHRKR